MVDSGAEGNFVSKAFVGRMGIPDQAKRDAYDIVAIDGNPLSQEDDGRVSRETKPLPVAIQRHHEDLQFDIVRIASYDIVLGIPWLKRHNPGID